MVRLRSRRGDQRLAIYIVANVVGQITGGFVALITFFAKRLQRNPFQFTFQRVVERHRKFTPRRGNATRKRGVTFGNGRQSRRGSWRIVLPDHTLNFAVRLVAKFLCIKWKRAAKKFIQHNAQRIHITASVNVARVGFSLLGTHVLGSANHLAGLGENSLLAHALCQRLGHAKVNHLRLRSVAFARSHKNISRFQIAVNNSLCVRMLNGVAHLRE